VAIFNTYLEGVLPDLRYARKLVKSSFKEARKHHDFKAAINDAVRARKLYQAAYYAVRKLPDSDNRDAYFWRTVVNICFVPLLFVAIAGGSSLSEKDKNIMAIRAVDRGYDQYHNYDKTAALGEIARNIKNIDRIIKIYRRGHVPDFWYRLNVNNLTAATGTRWGRSAI
jgi:hypothetical protein